jgi:ribosome-associated heat shock protein Hsp15
MAEPGQRLDKWLWFARLAKSRSLAARLIEDGKVRVNRLRVTKPGRALHVGDVLTAVIHGRLQVVKVLDLGTRRGPATEAQALYADMSPPPRSADLPPEKPIAEREPGSGRPTKRDRRRIASWTTAHGAKKE